MTKILKTTYPPIIDCYSGNASYCSILQSFDGYLPLIIINNLMIMRKSNSVLSFCKCERQNSFETKAHIENRNTNILDMVIDEIEKENYIFMFLNHFHLSCSDSFMLRNFLHGYALIYGVDDEHKTLYIADNLSNGKYIQAKIAFSEFMKAIQFCEDKNHPIMQKTIVSYHCDTQINYSIDLNKLKLILSDYLLGESSNCLIISENFQNLNALGEYFDNFYDVDNFLYGIDVYNWLLLLIESSEKIDVRPFSFLSNHKKVVSLLVDYLFETYNLKFSNYIEMKHRASALYRTSQITQNLVVKYNVSKQQEIVNKIKNNIILLADEEKYIFESILDAINMF